jgi:hypothetical protein
MSAVRPFHHPRPTLRAILLLAAAAGAWLRAAAPEDHTWVPRSTSIDARGQTTTRYSHFYKGLRVWGSSGISHGAAPGSMLQEPAWEGDPRQPGWSVALTPRLSPEQAQAKYLEAAGPLASPPVIQSSAQVIFPIYVSFVPAYPQGRPLNATDVVTYLAGTVLAYDLHVQATDGLMDGTELLLDASTGETLLELSDDETAATPVKGLGRTFYSGEKILNTTTYNGGWLFYLIDITRGVVFDASGNGIPGLGNMVLDFRSLDPVKYVLSMDNR